MIAQLRKYLKGLDNIQELMDNLPNIDNKSLELYYKLSNEIENEYDRIYKDLFKNEINKIKRGMKNDISK